MNAPDNIMIYERLINTMRMPYGIIMIMIKDEALKPNITTAAT